MPASNEAGSIGAVLRELHSTPVGEIVVVDGGSTAGTHDIAREHGARVVSAQPGYGRARATGAAAATGEVSCSSTQEARMRTPICPVSLHPSQAATPTSCLDRVCSGAWSPGPCRRAGRSKISGTVRGTVLAAYFIVGTTLHYAITPVRAGRAEHCPRPETS